jgi:hypothetical protein
MTTFPERLIEVMNALDLPTQKALADFCEVSEGLVAQWFKGDTKLGPKPLKAFSAKTYYNLDWLADGTLPKFRNLPNNNHHAAAFSPDEEKLLKAFRAANMSQRQVGLIWAETILAGKDLEQRSGTND